MRTIWKLSCLAPMAIALAACAAGGAENDEVNDDPNIGTDGGTSDSDADTEGDAATDEDASPDDGGDDPDSGDDPDGGDDPDAGDDPDGGEDPDAGDDPDGGEDPGDSGPDAPSDPCDPDQCFIDGACVAAGTLQTGGDGCEVCLPAENRTDWTFDATSPACDGKPYWHGVTRALPTTPYGRKTAISCHNCYVYGSSTSDSLSKTLDKVHAAQSNGADLIELDIKEHAGAIHVDHNDDGTTNGALFGSVISDSALKAGDQLLFIESKEKTESESYVRAVLETLQTHGYAKAGRPVVLRAFDGVSHNIALAQKLLALPEFASIRPHVRLQVLVNRGDGNDIAALQTRIKGAKEKGFHGVEFEYQTPNLFSALKYAESLDLGINVWTIPTDVGEVYVASMRDEVDAITVDYPVNKARQVVVDQNGLVYVNAWSTPSSSTSITWYADKASASASMSLVPATRPALDDLGLGQSLFGSSLRFYGGQAMPLYDGDNDPNDGFLVSAVARFDTVIPPDGETAVLVGKAEVAGFSLEVHNPSAAGNDDAVLRFGVRVDGSYHYATYPATKLASGPSYFITGAYDGDGGVWLWVNNSTADTTKPASQNGGVVQNDVPIVIGADPQPGGDVRFFFNGHIQMALVQKWANH